MFDVNLRGLTQSSFDSASAKNLVIVKGIIDVKQLTPYLKLKRTVEVVPAKTEKAVAERSFLNYLIDLDQEMEDILKNFGIFTTDLSVIDAAASTAPSLSESGDDKAKKKRDKKKKKRKRDYDEYYINVAQVQQQKKPSSSST
ncbi:hypothetical protein YC2023_104594 [Brassica napus]